MDIYAPVLGGTANMSEGVVYRAQAGDWSRYEQVLEEGRSRLSANGTLLFSAEDLENCLMNAGFGQQFASIAHAKGFTTRWVFVQRDPFEYFESLYGELAKHQQIMRYDQMAKVILKHGYLISASSYFTWFFVFDYASAVKRFRASVSPDVSVFTYRDFISQAVGLPIFTMLGKASEYAALVQGMDLGRPNKRATPEVTELNYTANFLKLSEADFANPAVKAQVAYLTGRRLGLIERQRPRIIEAFQRRFATAPPAA